MISCEEGILKAFRALTPKVHWESLRSWRVMGAWAKDRIVSGWDWVGKGEQKDLHTECSTSAGGMCGATHYVWYLIKGQLVLAVVLGGGGDAGQQVGGGFSAASRWVVLLGELRSLIRERVTLEGAGHLGFVCACALWGLSGINAVTSREAPS